MEALQNDRRAALPSPSVNAGTDNARAVRKALLMQTHLGSISAVEYLKAHDIQSDVITRVLTSQQIRRDDRAV